MENKQDQIKLKHHEDFQYGSRKIVKTANHRSHNCYPVPLPTEKQVYTILRAVYKYKDSREQLKCIYKRLIDIVNPNPTTVDILTRLDLPSGVDIEIKL